MLLRRLLARTDAQDLIEHGVLIGLIAAAVIVTASQLGVKVPSLYSIVADDSPTSGERAEIPVEAGAVAVATVVGTAAATATETGSNSL